MAHVRTAAELCGQPGQSSMTMLPAPIHSAILDLRQSEPDYEPKKRSVGHGVIRKRNSVARLIIGVVDIQSLVAHFECEPANPAHREYGSIRGRRSRTTGGGATRQRGGVFRGKDREFQEGIQCLP